MFTFSKLKFVIIIIFFSSCVNIAKKKSSNFTNENFYIVENINENNIISDITEIYDTNKMVFVKGGKFNFGSNIGLEREKPEREVIIQSFLIDKNLVTVKDFRTFVNDNNYITEAENFGNGIVYNDSTDIWQLVDGANWEFPFGKLESIALDDHPVTQVSWNDALAYCKCYNKTLPSEVQWEYAASERGQKKNQLFYWGNDLVVNNNYMCNTWATGYPNTIGYEDGFKYTSPEVAHEDLNVFYNSINLFVLPSYFEASACVLMEAWATNTPIISIKNQGISELIPEHEYNNLLADPKSPSSLKEKILNEYNKKRDYDFDNKFNILNTINEYLNCSFFKQ